MRIKNIFGILGASLLGVATVGALTLSSNGSLARDAGNVNSTSKVNLVSSSTPPVEEKEITVMTYNVCAGFCPSLAPWKTRAKTIAQDVAEESPDVLVTQETGGWSTDVQILREELEAVGYKIVPGGGYGRYLWVKDGVSVLDSGLWRIQAKGAGNCYHPLTGKKTRLKSGKVQYFPYATVLANGNKVTVAGVHLSASDCSVTDKHREYEAVTVYNKLKVEIRKHNSSPIIAGDFNSYARYAKDSKSVSSNKYRYRVFKALGRGNMVSAYEYTPAVRVVGNAKGSHSYVDPPSIRRNLGQNRQFDHVVISKGMSSSKRYSLGPLRSASTRTSDHRYVSVVVGLS